MPANIFMLQAIEKNMKIKNNAVCIFFQKKEHWEKTYLNC